MIASEQIVFDRNGLYDDGSGPAAMPVLYEGAAPTEEPGGTQEIVRPVLRLVPAQPVLIDASTGGSGISVNAPKAPETPAGDALTTLPSGGAPVLRAGENVGAPQVQDRTIVRTTIETRVMVIGLFLLAVTVAVIAWREGRES